MKSNLLLAIGAMALLTGAKGPEQAQINLRPVTEGGKVTAIDVRMSLPIHGELKLDAPVVYPGAPGVADRMTGIVVTDRRGRVPLKQTEDAPTRGGFPYFRHWTADRAIDGPVSITYRALVQQPQGPRGPAFGIRAVRSGAAGSTVTLLMRPNAAAIGSTRVTWDLSALPKGSRASMSHGDGNFTIAGGPSELLQDWFLVGPLGSYPATGGKEFKAFWLGQPTFDAPAEMAWTARAHKYLVNYFPHLRPPKPYRVYLQFREEEPYGGGTALYQSFMLSSAPQAPSAPGAPATAPRSTLFHEMIHMWTGAIDAPVGISSWFSEGLTTYYEHVLPMRGGFETVAQYDAAINDLAQRYYTSKARNTSALNITKVGFSDEEVRHTPYVRSALYFADLDARIRAKSGGARNLESLLFPMFLAREKGERFDHAKWIAMVTGELGPQEEARFQRIIIEGSDTLIPAGDAFGPCFQLEPTTFKKDGKDIAGHRWTRIAGVPDANCGKH